MTLFAPDGRVIRTEPIRIAWMFVDTPCEVDVNDLLYFESQLSMQALVLRPGPRSSG
jgi:hypothetical protein